MNLDPPLPEDVRSVLAATAMLDVSEYELFRLAWQHWHGVAPAERELEPHFVAYMFGRRVPPWVRHYARLVESHWHAGRVDRRALGLPQGASASRGEAARGARYAVAIGLVVAVVVVLAQFAGQVMELSQRCVFPPCY